jgi:hypothetical protein
LSGAGAMENRAMMHNHDTDEFDGTWLRYPPLRHALLSGLIVCMGFALAHLLVEDPDVKSVLASLGDSPCGLQGDVSRALSTSHSAVLSGAQESRCRESLSEGGAG